MEFKYFTVNHLLSISNIFISYTFVCVIEPALIAKSNIILDVKPWDDETDMKKMEEEVRKITTDGLIWGACKNT